MSILGGFARRPNVNGLSPWVYYTEVYVKWAKTTARYPQRSGSHSNKGMQMELKIGKKAATAPRHATAWAGWWTRPLHLPLSLRLPRQRTGPVSWMRSAG